MKFLKRLVVALLIIIVLILVVAIFLPSKRNIEESRYIKCPAKYIYAQVNDLKRWDSWTPFREGDTAMKIILSGPQQGVGAVMKWESKTQGNGTMTIVEEETNKHLRMKMEFEGQGVSYSDWIFTEEGDSTKVTWSLELNNLKYPVGRLLGAFMPGMIHKSFKTGLEKLEKVSENYLTMINTFKTSEVSIKEMEKQHILYIRDSSKCSEVGTAMGKAFGEVMQYIGMNNIECTAPPFARYLLWDEKSDKNIMECGIFVKGPVQEKNRIKYAELPAQKYASAIHYGSYETIPNTHAAIDKYVKDHKLVVIGPPMEIYKTDPQKEPDMTKWETEILYPVK